MDYFGKRDLIYLDMQGDRDVARMDTKTYIPRVKADSSAAEADGEEEE